MKITIPNLKGASRQLKDELKRLIAERSMLRIREAEIEVEWAKGVPTTRVQRAELELGLRKNAAAIREVEFLLEREYDMRSREHRLSVAGNQWSDQMVGAMTYLLAAMGMRDVVDKATKMVADGWNAPPPAKKQNT